MSKVVNMSGQPVPRLENPNEPVPAVVEELEKALEQARSGEMIGFSMAYLFPDMSTGVYRAGTVSYSLVGRMASLNKATLEFMEGD